jgi:ABC-type Fe3+/spermidine/putrescine transport system ATPase subunit
MTTHITLKNLSKSYDQVTALQSVSVEIALGKMAAVIGPSGCGKSTLLRLLAGFIQPDSGWILFNGDPVQHLPPERRPTVMVFQNYALWPHKTVFENVAFGLRVAGWNRKAIAHRVHEMLDLVELQALEQRYPNQLSGGQQQRVALARALAIAPEILLLDEPLSNLDVQTRSQMQSDLRTLQQRVGITTLYVTHDQEEALSMSDQIIVLREGHVEQSGTPLEVYHRPASPFVAKFLGQSNLLSGYIQTMDSSSLTIELLPTLQSKVVLTALRKNWMAEAPPHVGQQVTLAIKPEQVCLEINHPGQPCDRSIVGEVSTVRFWGARWQVTVRTQWGAIAAIIPDQSSNGYNFLEMNQTIEVYLPVEHLLVFAHELFYNS